MTVLILNVILSVLSTILSTAHVLTTERELVSRPPSWLNILGLNMPGRSIPCRWKGCSPFWDTGGHRGWYVPDSDSGRCASICSGRVGGVMGGMLKSSSPRLGTGYDCWQKQRHRRLRLHLLTDYIKPHSLSKDDWFMTDWSDSLVMKSTVSFSCLLTLDLPEL